MEVLQRLVLLAVSLAAYRTYLIAYAEVVRSKTKGWGV